MNGHKIDTYEAAKNLVQRGNPKIKQCDRGTVSNYVELDGMFIFLRCILTSRRIH